MNPEKPSEVSTTAEGDLLGRGDVRDLLRSPFRNWFEPKYVGYVPDAETIARLRDLSGGISVTIFLGTWCGDSRNEVPKFFKVLHEAGFDNQDVTMVYVDRGKSTPGNLENDYDIARVPTFIFSRSTQPSGPKEPNGEPKTEEINRIVETPRESLEKDMLKILSNDGYRHAYAE